MPPPPPPARRPRPLVPQPRQAPGQYTRTPMPRRTPSKSCCFVFLFFCAAFIVYTKGPRRFVERRGPVDNQSIEAEAEAEASYVAGFPVPLPLPPGPPVRLD